MPENPSSFSPQDRKQILESHLNVGRQKAVSYLPIKTIMDVLDISVNEYVSMIESLGNKAIVLGPQECCINSGAVYAYSCEDLDEILKEHHELLIAHGWPTSSSEFVRKMAVEWQDRENDVFQVIRKAFGE